MVPRIGIIGTCCTGKSTLVERIVKDTQLVYIEEGARNLYKQYQKEQGFDRNNPYWRLSFQYKLYEFKLIHELQAFNTGFIGDRTYLDIFMYFLYYCHKIVDKDICSYFENICKSAMGIYTHLFILDLDSIPYKQDDVRIETYGGALLCEASIYGLIQRWGCSVKYVPCSTLEERLEYIVSAVGIK